MTVACIVHCNSRAAISMVLLNSWEPPFSLGVLLLSTLPGIPIEGQILLCRALFREEWEVSSYSRKPSPDVRQDDPSGPWCVVRGVYSKLTDFSRKLWDHVAVGQDLSTVYRSKAVLQLDLLINQAIRQLHCSEILAPLELHWFWCLVFYLGLGFFVIVVVYVRVFWLKLVRWVSLAWGTNV